MPAKLLDRADGRPYQPPPREGWEEQADFESYRETARREGFEEGLRQGRAQADKEHAAAVRRLGRSIEELERLRRELIAGLHRDTVELALAAASRLLRCRIEEGDPVVLRVIEEALQEVPCAGVWKVHLHPADLELIQATEGQNPASAFELVADSQQQRGGVLIETGAEEVDGRIGTALAVLRESLTEGS